MRLNQLPQRRGMAALQRKASCQVSLHSGSRGGQQHWVSRPGRYTLQLAYGMLPLPTGTDAVMQRQQLERASRLETSAGGCALQGHVQGCGQRFTRCCVSNGCAYRSCQSVQIVPNCRPVNPSPTLGHCQTKAFKSDSLSWSAGQGSAGHWSALGSAQSMPGTRTHLYATSSYSQQWLLHAVPQNAHG